MGQNALRNACKLPLKYIFKRKFVQQETLVVHAQVLIGVDVQS